MEPLIDLPRGEWPYLLDVFRAQVPQNVVVCCLLEIQLAYPDLSAFFNFKVYRPKSNLYDGIIATSDQNDYYQVYIYPINMRIIEEALLTTKFINWDRNVAVPSAGPEIIELLKRVAKRINIRIINAGSTYKHFKQRQVNSKDYEDLIHPPPNTYVRTLKPQHLDIVNKTWTFCGEKTYTFFELLMKLGLIYVLYSSDHEPLAWIAINEAGAFTHLYCVELHRRKGYAEFITKFAIQHLAKKGLNALAYTMEDNMKPKKLFKKLGFEVVSTTDVWLFIVRVRSD